MAVYTNIATDQLIPFLAAYDVGTLERFEGIQAGVENSNFHIHTTDGRYILTLFEKRVRGGDLPYVFDFMTHLRQHGVQCPEAIPARDGHIIGTLAQRPAVLISFLSGHDIPNADVAPAHCRELGRAIAGMHRGAADFTGFRANELSLAGWNALADKCRQRADAVAPGLSTLIDGELDVLAREWPDELPAGAIHADIFPDNVFFEGDRLYGIIDFYFACNDFFAYDLAIAINAWCFDSAHRWDQPRFDALMDGYAQARRLSPAETSAMPVLLRGAAIRFLMTRLYDWLNHDPANFVVPKDPKDYLARLEFFKGNHVFG